MKKIYVFFAGLLSLSVFATMAFINNIAVLVRWWRSFLAANGDSTAMESVSGVFPFLDWSAVDHSAVTTFIPMLGLWCMTIALLKLIRRVNVRTENFPFFKGSDQLNVALGLFGTLWGIIVIGYFDLATVTMGDLMQCLHTALFSTLMAVVWVFMIDHPVIRPLFARLAEKARLAVADDDDLSAAVCGLVARINEAANSFEKHQKEFEEESARRLREYEEMFDKRFKAYEEALKARHGAYAEKFDAMLENSEEAFRRRHISYEAAFESRLAGYEKEFEKRQKEYVEFFARRIDELEKRVAEEKENAEKANARLAAVASALK